MQQTNRDLIDEAKRRIPLSILASKLGLGRLKPNGVQRSPLRDDKKPSFSTGDDLLWYDHATGRGGDAIDLIMEAAGCSKAQAIANLLAIAGLDQNKPFEPIKIRRIQKPIENTISQYDELTNLHLTRPSVGDLHKIAESRQWAIFAGLTLLDLRGMLYVSDVKHRGETHKSWILTDQAKKTGMARRIDGGGWLGPDGARFKSKYLRRDADNPIGLHDIVTNDRKVVVIAEGDPDALAAMTFAWYADSNDVGILRIDGNPRAITPAVADCLVGRRVRILRQYDKEKNGKRAASEFASVWAQTLIDAKIDADVFALEALTKDKHHPIDLADLLKRPTSDEDLTSIAEKLFKGLKK